MTAEQNTLWVKIKDFQFDKPNTKLTFKRRLMRENGFSESFAEQLLIEYKKFIFLCRITDTVVTPSHYVDIVWHLHLTYTKSYWIDLCQNILGKDLHHTPTEGGSKEKAKYKNLYDETLNFYHTIFNEKAPPLIWQKNEERFQMQILTVDKSKNWIIPKPNFSFKNFNVAVFVLLFCVILGCSANNTGSDSTFFIVFFGLIFLFMTYKIIQSVVASKNDSQNNSSTYIGYTSIGGESINADVNSNDSNEADGDSSGDSSDGGDSGCGGGCGGGGD